jgi:hypothetical protein
MILPRVCRQVAAVAALTAAQPGAKACKKGAMATLEALVSQAFSGLKRNREAAQLKPRHPPTCAISQT